MKYCQNPRCEEILEKYSIPLVALVLGFVLFGAGFGGFWEYSPPLTHQIPSGLSETAQIEFIKSNNEKLRVHNALSKSELASPPLFIGLMMAGAGLVIAAIIVFEKIK